MLTTRPGNGACTRQLLRSNSAECTAASAAATLALTAVGFADGILGARPVAAGLYQCRFGGNMLGASGRQPCCCRSSFGLSLFERGGGDCPLGCELDPRCPR